MTTYIDLHIQHGDIVLDAGLNPTYLTDRAVIAQDIVHAILETGLANLLVSDRGTGVTADTQTKIKLLVEDDVRIMPGTVQVQQIRSSQGDAGNWWVFADTIDFGPIESSLAGAL
jgi:phosphosulfolactate synthase (CoM biosynthesis protein A)